MSQDSTAVGAVGASPNPSRRTCTSNSTVQDAASLCTLRDTPRSSAVSPSANPKNELQELLQRSIFKYPHPKYDHLPAKGLSHKRQFACKCIVVDRTDVVIHQTQGEGTTKKEAEMNSALEMLPFIRAMLEDGGMLIPVSL